MNFEEALKLKDKLPSIIIHEDLNLNVYITPEKSEDFSRYSTDFREFKDITDDFAKLYSSDGEYLVRGICYYRDANRLYHIVLPV